MQYTDTLTKTFLTSGTRFDRQIDLSRWDNYEDPTYMGFWVVFDPLSVPTPDYSPDNLDYLPQGLFLPKGDPGTVRYSDSAVSFLLRRNEPYRAAMMQEFQEGFLYVAKYAPWTFTKISGLADLWKIDPTKPFRTKEVKIVLECKESVSMRMSYIVDLYRKAAFDAAYHRYILPDCQRMFSMEVIISEIRTLQIPGAGGNRIGGGIPFATGNFLKFRLDYCEFDFLSGESLGYLGDVENAYHSNAATVKIPIKVGRVREVNSYGLLGAILSDTFQYNLRTANYKNVSFTKNTTQTDATGGDVDKAINNYFVYLGETRGFFDGFNDYNKANTERDNIVPNSLPGAGSVINESSPPNTTSLSSPAASIGRVLTGLVATLEDIVSTSANAAILGNVYGFSASGLANTLEGLLNNPVGATQGLLQRNGVDRQVSSIVTRNVSLTGPDLQLVKDLIGVAQDIQSAVAGTPLEAITLGEIGQMVEASANLQGTPSNVGLSAAETAAAAGGKVNLEAPNFKNRIDPIAIALASSNATLTGNTGKVILTGPSSKLEGSVGKTDLVEPTVNTSNDTAVDLIAPNASIIGRSGRTELTGSDSSLSGNPGKEELLGSGTLEGRAEKVALEGVGSIEGDASKVELTAPTVFAPKPGSVDLEGPEVSGRTESTKVDLEEPPKGPNTNLGNVGLE